MKKQDVSCYKAKIHNIYTARGKANSKVPLLNYASRDEDIWGSGGLAPLTHNLCTR
jgi:hypothetical protein